MTDDSGALIADDDIIVDDNADNKKTDDLSVSDSELDNIRKDLENERRKVSLLQTEADDARRERTAVTGKLASETENRIRAEEVAIANAIAASTGDAERLENEIVSAQENGKFSEAAKLTRQLASAQTKIDSWEARKQQFDSWKEQQKNARSAQDATVEYPKSKAWIAQHPEFNFDGKFRNKVLSAHHQALSDGLTIDSDEYIEYIDNTVNRKNENISIADAGENEPDRVSSSRVNSRAVASVPPSRNGANMSGNVNGREPQNRLSAQEAEMAVLAYPKMKQAEAQKRYLDAKRALIGAGKMQGNA